MDDCWVGLFIFSNEPELLPSLLSLENPLYFLASISYIITFLFKDFLIGTIFKIKRSDFIY
ncbi:MAG: hypothetical protein LBU87_05795 [Lactobacillales bacterium]|nr:hypothetical protein [Lactobacillales bacterium]